MNFRVLAACLALVVAAHSAEMQCRQHPTVPGPQSIGLDNLSGYDIKIRECDYSSCSGNPPPPMRTTTAPRTLYKGAAAPMAQQFYLSGQDGYTFAITDSAIFRECDSDKDCPSKSYCKVAGHTPPYFCSGPSSA